MQASNLDDEWSVDSCRLERMVVVREEKGDTRARMAQVKDAPYLCGGRENITQAFGTT
jgi:hypothetical protein